MPKPHDEIGLPPPRPIKPLPGQRDLPFDEDAARRQAILFPDGRDLPGAAERDQQILWDLPTQN